MIRDIHLGIKLPFTDENEQEDSEDILMWLLGLVSRVNLQYLRRNPHTPALYDADVVYAPPDQLARPPVDPDKLKRLLKLLREMDQEPETALMIVRIIKGIEVFLDIPALYRRGKGDCNELAPVRVAELWRAGIRASPYMTKMPNERVGWTYHALVLWPDGSSEDPSLILGMGGPERSVDRREECRKNAERWVNHISAAQYLMRAEGLGGDVLGQQIDMMGLVPKNGVFRSPYPRIVGGDDTSLRQLQQKRQQSASKLAALGRLLRAA